MRRDSITFGEHVKKRKIGIAIIIRTGRGVAREKDTFLIRRTNAYRLQPFVLSNLPCSRNSFKSCTKT